MSYRSLVAMAVSTSLRERIAAAVATQGEDNPVQWAEANIWPIVASPTWDEKWDYAVATYTDDYNPDTGARPGVIADDDILAAVADRRQVNGEPVPQQAQ